jgi:hypothetical protein
MQIDGCLYALQTISIALYRTPENPYTSILVFYMACRIWEKLFISCHGLGRDLLVLKRRKYIAYVDIVISLINFELQCEFGMKEQFIFAEVWPLYFTLLIFVSYCIVKYRWIMLICVHPSV